MKKILCILMMVLGIAVFADTTTSITLSVTVAQKLSVAIAPTTWNIAMNNSGSEINIASQATLTIVSSRKNYTVAFSSANSGVLKAGVEEIPYYIKVDTSSWSANVTSNALSDYAQLTTAKSIVFNKKTPVVGKDFPVGFKVDSYTELYVDDVYSDTITITITSP